MHRWSFDYLRQSFAAQPITVARLDDGRVVMDGRVGLLHETTSLGEFLNGLEAGCRDRYMMSPLARLPTALTQDLPLPQYCSEAKWQDSNLWIGAPGTVSGMHWDLADNLHVQISGRKRFTLVSPRQSATVYPNGLFAGVPNGCRTDIEQPDFERFPRLREAEPIVAELEPGDALYIPRRWWHHVRTLDVSVSANFWWAKGSWRALVEAGALFKRLRGVSR